MDSHDAPIGRMLTPGVIDLWHPSPRKARLQRLLKRVVGRIAYERILFRWHVGYLPRLDAARTFNEKVSRQKLFADLPTAPLLADKVAVRDYVTSVADAKYLTPLLAVTDTPEALDWQGLAGSFVVKATHASGRTMLVPDSARIDEGALKARLAGYLASDFGRETNEWWYQRMPHRLVVEEFRRDETYGIPPDYKFYVFHGKARFVHVDLNRLGRHSCDFYDLAWQPAGFRIAYPKDRPGPLLPRPSRLDEMRELAETLAGELDFVRVDLLCANDREVVFGEMSLAPGSGWAPFEPADADERVGGFW